MWDNDTAVIETVTLQSSPSQIQVSLGVHRGRKTLDISNWHKGASRDWPCPTHGRARSESPLRRMQGTHLGRGNSPTALMLPCMSCPRTQSCTTTRSEHSQHPHAHAHTHSHTHAHIHSHSHTHAHTHSCMHTPCTHACANTLTHTHTHIITHTCLCAHTNICMQLCTQTCTLTHAPCCAAGVW